MRRLGELHVCYHLITHPATSLLTQPPHYSPSCLITHPATSLLTQPPHYSLSHLITHPATSLLTQPPHCSPSHLMLSSCGSRGVTAQKTPLSLVQQPPFPPASDLHHLGPCCCCCCRQVLQPAVPGPVPRCPGAVAAPGGVPGAGHQGGPAALTPPRTLSPHHAPAQPHATHALQRGRGRARIGNLGA